MAGGAFSKIRKSLLSKRRNRRRSDISFGAESGVSTNTQASVVSGKSGTSKKSKHHEPVVTLSGDFYDRERKLQALENAYLTLKKVLSKISLPFD